MPKKKLTNLIKKHKIPGISITTVSTSGKIVNQTAGIADANKATPVTDSTLFEVASLTKPVFAYIVLKMVERGQLSLDQPLFQIFPEFGPPELRNHPFYKMLTVQKILSHQAGLPNWFLPNKPEEYVAKPGEQFDYSGIAFCFLNEVVEKISGKSLEELAQELFTDKKMAMHHTSFLPPQLGELKNLEQAVGHDADGKSVGSKPRSNEQRANPAASLVTTASDYAKFLQACMDDSFIRKNMFKPQVELSGKDKKAIDAGVSVNTLANISWGIGIGLQKNQDGSTTAFHWGDNETNRSFAATNLQTKQTVVCLTNGANGPAIFRQVVEPVVGKMNAVFDWLAGREKLKFGNEPMITGLLDKKGFFKKQENITQTSSENLTPQQQNTKKLGN